MARSNKMYDIDKYYAEKKRIVIMDCKHDIKRHSEALADNPDLSEEDRHYHEQKIREAKEALADPKKLHHRIMWYVKSFVRQQPRKDNPSVYSNEEDNRIKRYDVSDSSIIRVPKLTRKSAWKRFYKLYPELRGKEVICGKSSSCGVRLNNSTIKLKKN